MSRFPQIRGSADDEDEARMASFENAALRRQRKTKRARVLTPLERLKMRKRAKHAPVSEGASTALPAWMGARSAAPAEPLEDRSVESAPTPSTLDNHVEQSARLRRERAESLAAKRDAARARKDFEEADRLRDELRAIGFSATKGGLIDLVKRDKKRAKKERQRERREAERRAMRAAENDDMEPQFDDTEAERHATKAERRAEKKAEREAQSSGPRQLACGVTIEDLRVGKGKQCVPRKAVKVNYTGKLKNGKVFDDSRGKPFKFRLGRGEVIKGWDIGVEGMRVGGKRRITCPPKAAYGRQANRQGKVVIPANSTLTFVVTLVEA